MQFYRQVLLRPGFSPLFQVRIIKSLFQPKQLQSVCQNTTAVNSFSKRSFSEDTLTGFIFTMGDFGWVKPVVGAAATVTAVTFALPAIGFGASGIAAGSLAAKAMSVAWTTGYGVGAISAAQSAGALGVAASTKVIAGVVGAVAARVF